MEQKNVAIKVDEDLHRLLRLYVADKDMQLKEFVIKAALKEIKEYFTGSKDEETLNKYLKKYNIK